MSSIGVHDQDDLEFMPDVHAAVRRRGRRFAYLLTVMSFLFLVVFGVWAHYAVLDEVTRGEGSVVPSRKTQVIQNLEGGILAEIRVREGDIVQEGDILVRIDNTQARASYDDVQSQYYSLLARIARIEAMLEERPIEFPPEVKENAPGAVRDQQALFDAQKRQLEAQISVLESQVKQRKQELEEMVARQEQLNSSLRIANEEMDITRPLVRNGVLPRVDLLRIERQVVDLQGELSTVRTAIPRLKTAIAEAGQRIDELVLSTRAELYQELETARAELNSIEQTVLAGQDRVTRTNVRSPVHGTIKAIHHTTVGGVIRPGEDILEIVPLDDTLLIEARIRPADIAFIRPGQEAVVKITAYDFSIYGGLKGEVENISADTIKDEEGESFYRVYLRTQETTLKRQGEELPIIPGMTATVEILTGEKSVLDYILKPILKARERALRER